MESRDGAVYQQNYDVIVKWLSDALRGQTLEVIGVKTGRIGKCKIKNAKGKMRSDHSF